MHERINSFTTTFPKNHRYFSNNIYYSQSCIQLVKCTEIIYILKNTIVCIKYNNVF